MTSSKKTIIAIFTFLPIVFMIWYFINVYSFIMDIENRNFNAASPMSSMMQMMVPMLLLAIVSLGTLIYYLVDIHSLNPKFKTKEGNNKIAWTLVVIFAGFVGKIVYFFVEINPRKEDYESGDDVVLDEFEKRTN